MTLKSWLIVQITCANFLQSANTLCKYLVQTISLRASYLYAQKPVTNDLCHTPEEQKGEGKGEDCRITVISEHFMIYKPFYDDPSMYQCKRPVSQHFRITLIMIFTVIRQYKTSLTILINVSQPWLLFAFTNKSNTL